MKLTKDMDIAAMQQQFGEAFPRLKIEAYKKSHKQNEGSRASDQYEAEQKLTAISEDFQPGEIVISPTMTVGVLEEVFEDAFGLHIQVFRKSGRTWLQTINTDGKTLEELSQMD